MPYFLYLLMCKQLAEHLCERLLHPYGSSPKNSSIMVEWDGKITWINARGNKQHLKQFIAPKILRNHIKEYGFHGQVGWGFMQLTDMKAILPKAVVLNYKGPPNPNHSMTQFKHIYEYKWKNLNKSLMDIFNRLFDMKFTKYVPHTHMPLKRRLYASVWWCEAK